MINHMTKSAPTGLLLALLWLPCAFAETAEAPTFAQVNLDQLIEAADQLLGSQANVLLKLPPHLVRFEATVAQSPKPRKAQYLLDSLEVMGVKPLPEVTDGMDVLSPNNKPLDVYLEKTVAERAGRELEAGDKVTLYGYHVYDSQKHGPGILVSGFETHSRFDEWKERLVKWLDEIR